MSVRDKIPSSFQVIFPSTDAKNKQVAIGDASTQSVALSNTRQESFMVRFTADIDCFLAVGSNPTATRNSFYLPAGAIEYLGIQANGQKVAVINKTPGQTGTLYLCEGI